jgi:2,3-bisphosphoglycerate-dependent phosphoglycerate mutase
LKILYIVRHAKAEGQPFEARLTEEGRRQAVKLAGFFKDKPVDFIYSSPFIRALETVGPLAESKGLEASADPRLGERVLSSLYFDDWQDKLKQSFDDFSLRFENGETQEEGMARAASVIKEALQRPEEHILLASHGNLSTLLLRYFDEQSGFDVLMKMSNPDVFKIAVSDDGHALERIWVEER